VEIFVGRQPILDLQGQTKACELLFRASGANNFTPGSRTEEEATQQLIANTLLSFGLDEVAGGVPAFINFPQKLLMDGTFRVLPNTGVVLELLETNQPTPELKETCEKAKRSGYKIAIDDFTGDSQWRDLITLADYLKVDFRLTTPAQRRSIARKYGRSNLQLLAEKVETLEERNQAAKDGYSLFQGYYFARPVVLQRSEVPALKLNCLRILQEVHRPSPDFRRLADLVRVDVSLCRKLLAYMNSAAFGWFSQVTSIERALTALGELGARRWFSIAVLPGLATDNATALISTALTRAHFCQAVAESRNLADRGEDYFLMGLFSLLDTMLGTPLDLALAGMALPRDIEDTLLKRGPDSHAKAVWRLVEASEGDKEERWRQSVKDVGLKPDLAPALWTGAIAWANRTVGEIGHDSAPV
jgi:EAL and modified HD-GYP domain-containing signal transduction protein